MQPYDKAKTRENEEEEEGKEKSCCLVWYASWRAAQNSSRRTFFVAIDDHLFWIHFVDLAGKMILLLLCFFPILLLALLDVLLTLALFGCGMVVNSFYTFFLLLDNAFPSVSFDDCFSRLRNYFNYLRKSHPIRHVLHLVSLFKNQEVPSLTIFSLFYHFSFQVLEHWMDGCSAWKFRFSFWLFLWLSLSFIWNKKLLVWNKKLLVWSKKCKKVLKELKQC